ncbi:MAG: ATP synthase F1 subunit delta [Bacteroidota bacterium]
MPSPRIAARYAKSLIDLALEQNQLEAVYADMKWLQEVCKQNRDFVNMLRSPIIKADAKQKMVAAITEKSIGSLTAAFNKLVIAKGREPILPEIAAAFIDAYKHHKGIQTLFLTTAAPISDATRQALVEQVKKTAGFQQVELHEKVDTSLIGGFMLQVGDKLVDASIAYDLRNIAKQFESNDFIYSIK